MIKHKDDDVLDAFLLGISLSRGIIYGEIPENEEPLNVGSNEYPTINLLSVVSLILMDMLSSEMHPLSLRTNISEKVITQTEREAGINFAVTLEFIRLLSGVGIYKRHLPKLIELSESTLKKEFTELYERKLEDKTENNAGKTERWQNPEQDR